MTHSQETKRLTRLSFWYPLSYLIPACVVLVFFPSFLLANFSNGGYSVPLARLVGAAMTGFTIMVLNVAVLRVEQLYDAVIYVRLPVLAIVGWLWLDTRDPLFAILFLTVIPGVFLSTICKRIDARRSAS